MIKDAQSMTAEAIFQHCVEAIRQGTLIERESARDKEFHFQDWFKRRLTETGLNFEQGGRNSYPDFALVRFTDGYEINLQANRLTPRKVPNPDAGKEHLFRAWRLKGSSTVSAAMRAIDSVAIESDDDRENHSE
jgi:hypothetical protein